MSVSITSEDITHYLEINERLNKFEAAQRHIRGYGTFTTEEIEAFPDPVYIKVKEWLESEIQ